MSIEVQERDIKLLKFVFACRVASYQQIVQRCFVEKNRMNAYRRVRKLCGAGLLKSAFVVRGNQEKKYVSVTEKAWPLIRDDWPFDVDSPHFKSESPNHDLRLNEILFKLEKLKTFRSFYPENLLQSSTVLAGEGNLCDLAKLQADGALLLNGPDGRTYTYGIEFEISKKTPERYREKLGAYYLARGIDGVIYVCSEREIVNSLNLIDRELRKEGVSILFFGMEKEVLHSAEKINFQNAKEHRLELY